MVNSLLSLVEFGAGAVALAVAVVTWQHRTKPAGTPLVIVALAGAGWSFGLALQPTTTNEPVSFALRSVVYLSTDLVAIGWLYLTAEYAGREWFKKRAVGGVILALLASNVLAMAINPAGAFYAPGTVVAADGVFVHEYGSLYWFDLAWKYALILVGIGILVVEVADRTGVYREQSIAVLFAGVVPSVFAFIEIIELVPIWGFSLSAIGISLSGVILLWSLFYADFLELPSIAQRTLMENMDAAIVAVDSRNRIIDLNSRAAALFGIDDGDLGATVETVFDDVPTLRNALDEHRRLEAVADRPRASGDGGSNTAKPVGENGKSNVRDDTDGAARNSGGDVDDDRDVDVPNGQASEPGTDSRTLTTEMRYSRGGETRYYELSVSPITSSNEGVSLFRTNRPPSLGRLLVIHDITERRENEKELRRANERLDQFVGAVSHDLRNPLSVASGYLELAKERGAAEDFETIEQAHNRMGRIINDLLTMARTETTGVESEPVVLAELAQRAWETTQTEGATLTVDLADSVTVDGDSDLLQHVFENLFRNAVDHNEPPLHVRVGPLESSHGFAIEDNGKGIPADQREAVFSQGHTTTDGGSGLGLSIVEELISLHGWSISVTESIEGGARFEIET